MEIGSTGVVWNTHTHNTLHSMVTTSDDIEPGVLLTPSGWRITAKVVMGLNIIAFQASVWLLGKVRKKETEET